MSEATLSEALACSGRGWSVIPLHFPLEAQGCSCRAPACPSVGKHPANPKGLLGAGRDPALLQRWFGTSCCNLGVVTGAVSGLVVLDIDPQHGGDASLGALETRHGKLPSTVEVLTGGGGRHLYFAHPGGRVANSAGKLGPGLDVRGDGGYVVAPPSLHRSGRSYAWEQSSLPGEVALAALPGWLLELLQPPPTPSAPAVRVQAGSRWAQLVAAGAQEGARNESLAALVGHLFRNYRGHPRLAAELAMLWNAHRCQPPLPDDEALRTISSIWARESVRRGQRGARG